jgi:hypothetical protein
LTPKDGAEHQHFEQEPIQQKLFLFFNCKSS